MSVCGRWVVKVVLGSPVRSGFFALSNQTETETGLHRFVDCKRPRRTDMDWSRAVLCRFLWLTDWSQPVAVKTGLGLVLTMCILFIDV
jgi:hypothetical protein